MHRPIGRYLRSKPRRSPTLLNVTSHLLCVYFRLRTAHRLCKNDYLELGLLLRLASVVVVAMYWPLVLRMSLISYVLNTESGRLADTSLH